jgi:hypothetical protein
VTDLLRAGSINRSYISKFDSKPAFASTLSGAQNGQTKDVKTTKQTVSEAIPDQRQPFAAQKLNAERYACRPAAPVLLLPKNAPCGGGC